MIKFFQIVSNSNLRLVSIKVPYFLKSAFLIACHIYLDFLALPMSGLDSYINILIYNINNYFSDTIFAPSISHKC